MEAFRATDIQQDSDSALVTAARRGNTYAFEGLVLRHERRVFAVAPRITKNREDAEDVVQETFHKIFLHLDNFQETSRFSTWLTRIAITESLILLRRNRRVAEVLPESPEGGVESISEAFVDQSPSPEESSWRRERTELLAEAINRLGPKVRRTILLSDIEERSAEETAELLGTSISALTARDFQGRRKLRRMVNPAILLGVSTATPTEAHSC